jgi:hypothetical protein
MGKSSNAIDATASALGLSVTALARLAKIDVGDLHDVSNGRTNLTGRMLSNLVGVEDVPVQYKVLMTQAFCEDRLPPNARSFVRVVPKADATGASELRDVVVQPSPLDRDLSELMEMARSNPALARAMRDLLRVIKGEEVAV